MLVVSVFVIMGDMDAQEAHEHWENFGTADNK
jgi:hypothetical protein